MTNSSTGGVVRNQCRVGAGRETRIWSSAISHYAHSYTVDESMAVKVYNKEITSHGREVARTHGLLTRRTDTPVSPGGISRLFPSQIRGGGSVLSIFRLSRGSSEGLWPSFVGRKATELSSGRALICRGSYFLISLTFLSESNYYKVDRVGGRSY